MTCFLISTPADAHNGMPPFPGSPQCCPASVVAPAPGAGCPPPDARTAEGLSDDQQSARPVRRPAAGQSGNSGGGRISGGCRGGGGEQRPEPRSYSITRDGVPLRQRCLSIVSEVGRDARGRLARKRIDLGERLLEHMPVEERQGTGGLVPSRDRHRSWRAERVRQASLLALPVARGPGLATFRNAACWRTQ